MKESSKTVQILISLGCVFMGISTWSYMYTVYFNGMELHPFFYVGSGLMGMWLLVYGFILLDRENKNLISK